MAGKGGKKGISGSINEPSVLVRPVKGFGGLDGIHVALIVLALVLIALLLIVSYYKPVVMPQQNATQNASTPGNTTRYTASQIKKIADGMVAGYLQTNSSLSLLPFYTDTSMTNASYIPQLKDWYVSIPSYSAAGNGTFYVSALISDANGSLVTPFIQLARPYPTGDMVVSRGVVALSGKPTCLVRSPLQAYWFMDPYAPGAVQSLENITALKKEYGNGINISIKTVYGSSYQRIADQVGALDAQYLGKYVMCASLQSGFGNFSSALNSIYGGDYISQNTLESISGTAGLNVTALDACVNSASSTVNAQALFASYYNITSVPAVVVDCKYLAIPQTANNAVCYANSTMCKGA